MGEVVGVRFSGEKRGERVAVPRAKVLKMEDDPLMDALPTDAKRFYASAIPAATRRALSTALYRTERWINDNTGRTINPDFKENNLDHVTDLIQGANTVKRKYPKLYLELTGGDDSQWLDLLKMLAIHDLGEFYTGDITATHTDVGSEAGIKHKQREAWAAKRMLKRGGGKIADELVNLYDRFEHRQVSDTIVRFGHLLDKAQAAANVARHVIPFNNPNEKPEYDYAKEMLDSIQRPMSYAISVAEALKTKEAKRQFVAFLEEFFLMEFRNLGKIITKEKYDQVFFTVELAYRNVFNLE